MKIAKSLCAVALSVSAAAGCGGTFRPEVAKPVEKPVAKAQPTENESAPMRIPGDFAVYRISGSYRESPVSITQRVVAHSAGVIILDMTIDEGGASEQLRLRVDDTPEHRGELLSVAKMEGGMLKPFGVAAYEQRMSEIVPAADDNEGEIGTSPEVLKVGATPIACTRIEYRVRIGAHRAVMSTLSAQGMSTMNLGGKVVSDDGTVIYQAQLVELGNRQPNELNAGKTIAATEEDLLDLAE